MIKKYWIWSAWKEVDDIPLIFLSNINEYQNVIEANYEAWLKANKITCSATPQDYIEVDIDLCTAGFHTDDDIVDHYCPQSESTILSGTVSGGEGSVQETIHQPSRNDDAFRTLSLYLQTNDTTTDEQYKALH